MIMNKIDWALWRMQMWRWFKGIFTPPIPHPPVDYNELYKLEREAQESCSHPTNAQYEGCAACGGMWDIGDGVEANPAFVVSPVPHNVVITHRSTPHIPDVDDYELPDHIDLDHSKAKPNRFAKYFNHVRVNTDTNPD